MVYRNNEPNLSAESMCDLVEKLFGLHVTSDYIRKVWEKWPENSGKEKLWDDRSILESGSESIIRNELEKFAETYFLSGLNGFSEELGGYLHPMKISCQYQLLESYLSTQGDDFFEILNSMKARAKKAEKEIREIVNLPYEEKDPRYSIKANAEDAFSQIFVSHLASIEILLSKKI